MQLKRYVEPESRYVTMDDVDGAIGLLKKVTASVIIDRKDKLYQGKAFTEAREWSKENCIRGTYFNIISGRIDFESEDDAMAFVLRWM